MDEQQEREQRGLVIAATAKLEKAGENKWFVPSQSNHGSHHGNYYVVKPDPVKQSCSCPDFTARQRTCKHLYAVTFVIQREFSFNEETQTETVTETVTVKQTYAQQWTAYNRAQVNEKDRFLELLAELCKGIEEMPQTNGRPRLPLGDMIFASTFKVYSTVSGRRFMCDVKNAQCKGYLTHTQNYNS